MKRICLVIFLFWTTAAFSQNKFLTTLADSNGGLFLKVKSSSDGCYLASGFDIILGPSIFSKIDSLGNVIFCKKININTAYNIVDFIEFNTNYFLLCNYSDSSFILELDFSGNFLSSTGINTNPLSYFNSIERYGNSFFLSGGIRGGLGQNIVLLNCDTNGVVISAKKAFNPFFKSNYVTINIDDNDYYITGNAYDSTSSSLNLFVAKGDTSGNIIWNKNFNLQCLGLVTAEKNLEGGIIIANTVQNTPGFLPTLINIDSNGVIIWTKTYSDSLETLVVKDIKPIENQGYILTGTRNSWGSNQTIFLMRIDQNGNPIWCRTFQGAWPNSDSGNQIIIAPDKGFVIVGSTTGFPISNSTSGFLIKTDSLGDLGCYQDTLSIDTGSVLLNESVLTFTTSNIGVSYFNINAPTLTNETGNIICSPTLNVHDMGSQNILLYPNPVSTFLKLQLNKAGIEKQSLNIYNFTGEIVFHKTIISTLLELDFSNLPNGIYFYQLSNSENNFTGKFIVAH